MQERAGREYAAFTIVAQNSYNLYRLYIYTYMYFVSRRRRRGTLRTPKEELEERKRKMTRQNL